MPTCWGRVSFYLPPFLQISKGVDCFPGVVTVQGLWAQGAGAVFTREAGASLGAGLSHPPCLLPSFAPFSNAACFLSPSEERRGEDDDAERGWTLSRNQWPSPGLLWVAEVCFCTAAGVWWHVVPHRLEMGPPCHLRPPPKQSQMPPPDSEPPVPETPNLYPAPLHRGTTKASHLDREKLPGRISHEARGRVSGQGQGNPLGRGAEPRETHPKRQRVCLACRRKHGQWAAPEGRWLSHCGPWTSSIDIPWELVGNVSSSGHLRPADSDLWGGACV